MGGEQPTSPVSITSAQSGVWGVGRAEFARAAADGTVVIASTTGVDVIEPGGGSTRLQTFAGPQEVSALARSADGASVAVAIAPTPQDPPRVDLYRSDGSGTIASWPLAPGDGVNALVFTDSGSLFVRTAGAVTELTADAAVPPIRHVEDLPLGGGIVGHDGSVIAPLVNTNELVVRRAGGAASTERIDELEGQLFVDAALSPGQDAVAVSMQSIEEFDQLEGIAVLDAATLDLRAAVPAGGAGMREQWTLGDGYVAVTDGVNLVVTEVASMATHTLASPSGSPLARLLPTSVGLVAVHADGGVTTWDVTNWAVPPRTVLAGSAALRDVTVDAGGTTLTAVDFFGRVVRVALADGTMLFDDTRFTSGELTSVGVDPAGTSIAVASSSGRVSVLGSDLSEMWAVDPGEGRVESVNFVPTSGLLATGVAERLGETAFDDTVIVWDPSTRSERFRLTGQGEDVPGCFFFYSRIRFSHDGSLMAATSHDFTVVLSDATSGETVKVLPPHASTVLDVGFTPDDRLLVTTSDDSTVRVWNVADWSLAAEYPSNAMGGYSAVAVMPDNTTIVVTDVTGAITKIDLLTGTPVTTFEEANYRSTSLALSADGALLAAPADDGTAVAIWSTDTGKQLATITGHTRPVTGLVFAPDGTSLITSSTDGTVRTWSIAMT